MLKVSTVEWNSVSPSLADLGFINLSVICAFVCLDFNDLFVCIPASYVTMNIVYHEDKQIKSRKTI